MDKSKKNLYEGMYIFSAVLSEDARQRAIDRATGAIANQGGEVHKVHDQGRKKLAYEIDGHRDGVYALVYFSIAPEALLEMKEDYKLHEDIIRYMILRTDKVKETLEFKSLVEQQ